MVSKNLHIWLQHGLTPGGAEIADQAMPTLLKAASILPPEIAKRVFEEAVFQVHGLPDRTQAFRKKWKWRK